MINFRTKRTICIVDDHLLLSEAMAGLINKFENYVVLSTFANGKEYIKYLESGKKQPDITLMDVKMPIMDGFETTWHLAKFYPKLKVLALSVEGEESTILKMLRNGAKGYLLKDIEKKELEHALDEIFNHGFYHSANVKNALENSLSKPIELVKLNEKEIKLLQFCCSEMTYREIAEKMFLSPKTVDNYRNTLFQKLNVKNRVGLVIYAIKNNIYKLKLD